MSRVRDIMQTDLITVPPHAPVAELVRLLERAGITGAPVVGEDGSLLGIVTIRDVVRLARELDEIPEAARWGLGVRTPTREPSFLGQEPVGEFFAYYVTADGNYVDVRDQVGTLPDNVFDGYEAEDIMTSVPITIESSASLRNLARLLHEKGVRRALVVEEGGFVGIVTQSDIVRALAES